VQGSVSTPSEPASERIYFKAPLGIACWGTQRVRVQLDILYVKCTLHTETQQLPFNLKTVAPASSKGDSNARVKTD